MSGHTPAPWEWLIYPDGRKLLTGPNNAVIHCPYAPITIGEPDRMLIAVAPELLAACEECLAAIDAAYEATGHLRVARTSDQRMRLEAAIAKAREH